MNRGGSLVGYSPWESQKSWTRLSKWTTAAISDKVLISTIHKNSYNPTTTTTKQFNEKNTEELNRHFSKKDIQVANRYIKRCLTSLIIMEMQIKITSYHLTPFRTDIIKKTNDKYWQEYGDKGSLCTVGRNVNWYSHYGKKYGGLLRN